MHELGCGVPDTGHRLHFWVSIPASCLGDVLGALCPLQREATGWMQRMSCALSGPVCLVMLLVSCVLTRRTTKPGRFLRLASPRCILVWASQPAGFV